jgi:hypothetical protein
VAQIGCARKGFPARAQLYAATPDCFVGPGQFTGNPLKFSGLKSTIHAKSSG